MSRPCRYCIAAYPDVAEICEDIHRDEQRVYDLAVAMAGLFPMTALRGRCDGIIAGREAGTMIRSPSVASFAVRSAGPY